MEWIQYLLLGIIRPSQLSAARKTRLLLQQMAVTHMKPLQILSSPEKVNIVLEMLSLTELEVTLVV